nr:immunoglobulin heavy chain junction region [Macaca mulatta]
CTARYSAFSFW